MKFRMKLICLYISILCLSSQHAQTIIFAELSGSPNMNTNGWNLTGAAYVGDTGGDVDSNSDELILTDNVGSTSGAVFFGQPLDLATCYEWNVQFDFRMADGNNADGIAFCFLDVPPTGFVSGGGVGIPSTADGVKVVFDSYDNGCGQNPEIQIMNGIGYNECDPNVIRVTNADVPLGFLTDESYKTAIINYSYGTLTVNIDGQDYITGNYALDFTGYLGFTASTGGLNDRHSIKNVTVFATVAPSDAGPDIFVCNGEPIQIGSTNNVDYIYEWNESTSLSATNISNPIVNLENSGESPVFETFVVTTTLASNPNSCPTTDTVTVTVFPVTGSNIDTAICSGNTLVIENQSFDEQGNYQLYLQNQFGCDSIIQISLNVNPSETTTFTASICEGESFSFYGEELTTSGLFTHTDQNIFGCDSVVNLNLNVIENPPSPLIASNSPVECPGDILELSAIADQSALFFWSGPQNFTSNEEALNIPLTLLNSGVYSLFVEVNGCPSPVSSTNVSIENINTFDDFDFPNIITPNGDETNDELDIKAYFKTCQSFQLSIFNRWGNIVFTQNENSSNFSGNNSSGIPLKDGTYFYKLSYDNEMKSGNIQIVR